jgi:hypothetical protein
MSKAPGTDKWNTIIHQVCILNNKPLDDIFTEVAKFSVSSTEHQLAVCYFVVLGFEGVSWYQEEVFTSQKVRRYIY